MRMSGQSARSGASLAFFCCCSYCCSCCLSSFRSPPSVLFLLLLLLLSLLLSLLLVVVLLVVVLLGCLGLLFIVPLLLGSFVCCVRPLTCLFWGTLASGAVPAFPVLTMIALSVEAVLIVEDSCVQMLRRPKIGCYHQVLQRHFGPHSKNSFVKSYRS